jgi:hypothetical protein
MYGVAGEKRPIFSESDAFLYNLDDPTIGRVRVVGIFTCKISCNLIYENMLQGRFFPNFADPAIVSTA